MIDLVRNGDVDRVRAALKPMTEKERRAIAPTAIRMLREVRAAHIGAVTNKAWPYAGESRAVLNATQVLALGTMTAAELRKAGRWALPPTDLAYEALTARSILLADYVDAIAEEPPTRWNSTFKLMRSIVRAGLVEQPANPGYILAMISGLEEPRTGVYKALMSDPDLLKHEVWRLFEVEGGGETSLAAHDKYTPEQLGWDAALIRLSADGLLPRDRLLDVSLAALRRDFAAFRAGWFSRFHEAMHPTRDERRARVIDYLALLTSPTPATVSFAVQALVEAGGVSDEHVDQLRPALDAKATSTVKGALRLLPRTQRSAALVAEALVQASREAQPNLIGFLERLPELGPDVRGALVAAAPNIAPSLRGRLTKLTGEKLEHVGEAVDQPPPQAASLRPPVESLHELVEVLAGVLERMDDVHELERALDGVSRLCDRSAETVRRLDPIARRARQVLEGAHAAPFGGVSPRADFANLILAWADGRAPKAAPRRSVLGFLSMRVYEVAARAASGKPQPILSLPTARGGAIDPATLASRREALRRLRIKPGDADAIQAALRGGEIASPPYIRFEFGTDVTSHTYKARTFTHVQFHVRVTPPPRRRPELTDVPGLFIAALLAEGHEPGEADYCRVGDGLASGLRDVVRWVATVWPSHREPFYARGAAELGRNIDWWQAMWHTRHFFEPLLLADEPIGEMARLLIAEGLGAKEPGERSTSTDVFVAATSQRRLDAVALGEVLARLCDQREVKPARLATSLGDAARVSSRHADAVVAVIESMLGSLHGPPPTDLAALLSVLSDSLAGLDRRLSTPVAVAYLSGIEGSGKAARLAKSLVSARA